MGASSRLCCPALAASCAKSGSRHKFPDDSRHLQSHDPPRKQGPLQRKYSRPEREEVHIHAPKNKHTQTRKSISTAAPRNLEAVLTNVTAFAAPCFKLMVQGLDVDNDTKAIARTVKQVVKGTRRWSSYCCCLVWWRFGG